MLMRHFTGWLLRAFSHTRGSLNLIEKIEGVVGKLFERVLECVATDVAALFKMIEGGADETSPSTSQPSRNNSG